MSSPSGPSQPTSQTVDASLDPSAGANFKSMLDAALIEYKNKTGKDLQAFWLASELQTCESADSVIDLLRDQAKTLDRSDDQKLMGWIDPLVHVLSTFSDALGDGVSLAFPPAKVIFTGISALLGAAKDARASQAAVMDLFERIESFFKRLEVYNQISLNTKMSEVLVKIVIELLSILSIATKEVGRRRAKLFAMKLLGRKDIEDALKRLDSLIQEEFQMVTAQILKLASEVKDGVDKTNVAMQQVSNNTEEVMLNVVEVKCNVVEVKHDVEEVKWAQIEQDIQKWVSPPDPSTNYNIACEAQHEGTAAWFFQGWKFEEWMLLGSLLWINGKPGSGKSILCSAIIKHIISLREAGQASLAYFYFDFRDKDKKQDFRNFITSLLVQLSAYSSPCCKIISDIYSTHGKGAQQPSIGTLKSCLREMLVVAAQKPTYIIVDALDECPNLSGMPTPREVVLGFLKDLVGLRFQNLHICVTSRPEIDIKKFLGPLARSTVSLHEESGQMKDIFDYVRDVVYSDSMMQRWQSDQKELVIAELSTKADGMFRWVFCQLEVLRHCLPASIRQALDHLPESLDDTYLHVLRQIPLTNQAHAHRMLQCLMVAVRPLRVEELAEVLAFEFDAAQGGIPRYRAAWRLDDQTQAVLSTCSSLVTVVSEGWYDRQVVQFSHFSVKEFLMSNRLGDFSRYHIQPLSAHTILTQACLGVILHLDDNGNKKSVQDLPLAKYAAEHWVKHAKFEDGALDVASRVKDGMKTLFDSDKPHFAGWIGIYDMNNWHEVNYYRFQPLPLPLPLLPPLPRPLAPPPPPPPPLPLPLSPPPPLPLSLPLPPPLSPPLPPPPSPPLSPPLPPPPSPPLPPPLSPPLPPPLSPPLSLPLPPFLPPPMAPSLPCRFPDSESDPESEISPNPKPNPLYYSALCGFYDLAKYLVIKFPQHVNAIYGLYKFPLFAALSKDHLEIGRLLLEHGANVDARGTTGKTLLLEVFSQSHRSLVDIVTLLLKYGADVNFQDRNLLSALHLAEYAGELEVARTLLKHKADANSRDRYGKTPLHIVSERRLGIYSQDDILNHARLLFKFGADLNRQDNRKQTPLHLAMGGEWFTLARVLIEHNANPQVEDSHGTTPLHLLSASRIHDGDTLDLVWLLLWHGAKVNKRDQDKQTPLHLAIMGDWFELARILLDHGADANAEDICGRTPLLLLSTSQIHDDDALDLAWSLLEHGAELNKRNKGKQTPLHPAIGGDWFKLARILLDQGVNPQAEDSHGTTPLHLLSASRIHDGDALDLVWLLLWHGAEVNKRDQNKQTPLHLAIMGDWFELARILLYYGADANAEDIYGWTPLLLLSDSQIHDDDALDLVWPLLDRGAELNKRNKVNQTPLLLAIGGDWFKLAQILLEHGADADVDDNNGATPLHLLSASQIYGESDSLDLLSLLLGNGAAVNGRDKNNQTPLLLAMGQDWFELAQILLEHGADANMEDNNGKTPLHILSERQICNNSDVGDGKDVETPLPRSPDCGAENNVQDQDPITPFCSQYNFGPVQIAQALLDHGANVNAGENVDETSLFRELEGVHVQTIFHHTPLHSASLYGRFDIVRLFLDHGATTNSKDKSGRTPLHLVAEGEYNSEKDYIRTAQLLLERGADANAQDEDGATPLHLASYSGKVEIARVLLDRGAAANLKGSQGRTPLHCVAQGRYLYSQGDGIRVAKILLEHGADANAPDENNRKTLHLASAKHEEVEIAREPLDRGAGVSWKGDQGQAPLHLVVTNGYSRDNGVLVAQLLLERGADANAPDDDNQTPLHLASNSGKIKMVQVLLNAGANASAKDAQDQTPFHVVSQGPYGSRGDVIGIVRPLSEHGADVNARYASPYWETVLKTNGLKLHIGGRAIMLIDYPRTQREQGVMEINVEQSPIPSTNILPASVLEAPISTFGFLSPYTAERAVSLPEANASEVPILPVPVPVLPVPVPTLPPLALTVPVPYEFR